MKSSIMNKTILAVAILTMAAFAGVMIVGDDTDAAEGVYTITYSYDGLVFSEKTTDGKIAEIKDFQTALPNAVPPTGYEFKHWVSGASAYAAGTVNATFTADATLTPVFEAAQPIIKLTYGDKSGEYMAADGATTDYTIAFSGLTSDALKTVDLGKFATLIGAKLVTEEVKDDSGNVTGYEITGLLINGYKFCGFLQAGSDDDAEPTLDFTDVIASGNKVVEYEAIFEKVYGVSFIVEGASVLETTSDKIEIADGIATGAIPVAPSKANYTFVGWYNAAGEPVFAYSLDLKQYSVSSEDFKIVEGTVLYAKFVPANMTVTFQIGEETVTQTVLYGAKAMKPELPAGYVAWMYDGKEFDFNTPITEEITIVALEAAPIEPTTVYDITFEIADKTPVVQKSDSMVIPDTTLEGYIFQGWVVKNGAQYVDPVEYVKTITENVTFVAVYKLATESAFTVTFEIEGKSPITQKADSLTIPDTTREGFDFTGWVVKGSSDYVDPMTYAITADITFVAVYKAVEVVEYTATFVNGDDVVAEVKVIAGQVIAEVPEAPEGMFWLFNKDAAITADVTIEAKPMTVTVQFAVGEKVYNAYTQTVAYGEKIDVTKLADFIFPEGFDSWNYDFNEPVTADMTVYAKAIPAPEKEPAFYQTPMGQCAIILAVFIVGLVFYGIFTGRITVPKFKISRAEKTEAPVEQVEEEKKP